MENNKNFYLGSAALVLVVIAVGAVGILLYRANQSTQGTPSATSGIPLLQSASSSPTQAIDTKIANAYAVLESSEVITPGSSDMLSSVATLRDIAADENNTNLERAQALNGINYAYTQSNFDAADIANIVFSQPPFSAYYTAPTTQSVDPLHPESGPNVAAVEAGLVKLNELSNSLVPNHYAITRMELADIFSYQRDSVNESASQAAALETQQADKIKDLVAAFNALPPLASLKSYSASMTIQIMFAHASALAFVGHAEHDKTYLTNGEAAFQQTISFGDSYQKSNPDSLLVQDQTLLARIFYATYYWKEYQKTDPQRIEAVLEPLTDVSSVQNTAVYTSYLPTHKDANVGPFTTLRLVAAVMPELKTFLQGLGWKF